MINHDHHIQYMHLALRALRDCGMPAAWRLSQAWYYLGRAEQSFAPRHRYSLARLRRVLEAAVVRGHQPEYTDCGNCGTVDHGGYKCPCCCHGGAR